MRRPKKLPEDYLKFLAAEGLSLSEIQNRLFYELSIEVSRSTIWRRLQRLRQ